MSTGTYGIKRGADITPDDVEIFLHYTASRDKQGGAITKLDPTTILIPNQNPNRTQGTNEIFGGLYTLKLPTTTFGSKGIYTLMIKPKETRVRIVDCGVLSSNPDIKDIVLDLATIPAEDLTRFENGNLTGYRIEYLNNSTGANESKISNFFRIVTSNNRAEPVNQNLNNSNQKAIRYRFNDNASLLFCTVSPSSSPNVKPNATPFIGEPNQEIIITNTFFNPLTVEIEMVEHDVETLAYAIYGPSTKSIEDGIFTTYNFDEEIYQQADLYEIKEEFTGKPLYEVKEPRTNIDFSKQFNNIRQ